MVTEQENRRKFKVQLWIVGISLLILCGKFTAYLLTNSVGILTDAMESIVNVTAGFISLYSIWLAAKPKDENHPFGHGKVELISASLEGLMIVVAGGIIIFEAIKRIFEPAEIYKLDTGIIIIAVSGLINYLAGWYSIRIGKKYGSFALIAGGKHLHSDTYSTIGLVLGLILLLITKISWIDSALALIFGAIIMVTGIGILRKTISNLMDKADLGMLEKMVEAVNRDRKDQWIDVHNLKAIKYGNVIYIDCDLTIPWYYNTIQGHDLTSQLQETIAGPFHGDAVVSIHTDPCRDSNCPHCTIFDCPVRQAEFTGSLPLSLKYITSDDDRIGEL